jgi:[amino group carrier protein]-L-2-aminoadipate 6-kinase
MRHLIVVKCGGNATVDSLRVCADIASWSRSGWPIVLVHGGSADIDRLCARLGVPVRRLTSPDGISARYTDLAALEVVQLALAGLAKPRLVTALVAAGVAAVGLTGLDAGLVRARRKPAHRAVIGGRTMIVRDDHSGVIESVNAPLLAGLLEAGVLPVISPPALAGDGSPVNVDADRLAGAVAAALHAQILVLLTGAPGILADPADEGSLIGVYQVASSGPPRHVAGGIGLKLVAAREALRAGVPRVLVSDGRRERPLLAALSGAATQITLAGEQDAATPRGRKVRRDDRDHDGRPDGQSAGAHRADVR